MTGLKNELEIKQKKYFKNEGNEEKVNKHNILREIQG